MRLTASVSNAFTGTEDKKKVNKRPFKHPALVFSNQKVQDLRRYIKYARFNLLWTKINQNINHNK